MTENQNAHKSKAGLVAVLLSCDPDLYVLSVEENCISHEIVIIEGIACDCEHEIYNLVYHKWKTSFPQSDVYDIIRSGVSNLSVIEKLFELKPSIIDVSQVRVMYFNQISGPSHQYFVRNIYTFRHSSGHDVFESTLLQDSWCSGRYLPLTIANNYNFLRFVPQSELRSNVCVGNQHRKHESAVLAGSNKIHQANDQTIIAPHRSSRHYQITTSCSHCPTAVQSTTNISFA